MKLLIIILLILMLMLIYLFTKNEPFAIPDTCNWFNYETDNYKCPQNTKCANIGICKSNEDCNTFPSLKCK